MKKDLRILKMAAYVLVLLSIALLPSALLAQTFSQWGDLKPGAHAVGFKTVQPVWVNKAMKNHFASSILHEGYLYGFDDFLLTCLEVNTGKTQWQQRGFQKGSLLFADGHLLVLGERGNLALVEATPAAYMEKANAQVLKGKCWTVPSLANGKLYLRNEKEMLCLDVTGKNL